MRLSNALILPSVACLSNSNAAFISNTVSHAKFRDVTVMKGYLDDLSSDLYKESAVPDVEADLRENNQMSKEQLDRYGPGNLQDFVDFNEFDGGDGQMGVAGDGGAALDKSDFKSGELANSKLQQTMNKSQMRSAKNAWGSSSTGYAQQLIEEKGMDTARAQQLENWANQQEIRAKNQALRNQAEQFDRVEENAEQDWRTLSKFGVERNTEVDLNEEFGQVSAGGDLEGTFEFNARTGAIDVREFSLKNPYMGFADFRAALTPDSSRCFSVSPNEGALHSGSQTEFNIKFRPDGIGTFEGALVIETEDFKKTWKLIGGTG